jgi:anti-anti-sigma factor
MPRGSRREIWGELPSTTGNGRCPAHLLEESDLVNRNETPSGEAPFEALCVELLPASAPGYAAILHLRGEHDLATSGAIIDALKPLVGDVLVDLSACTFIDSTVIGTLIHATRESSEQEHRLELVVPAENRLILRTLEVSGATHILTVRATTPASR